MASPWTNDGRGAAHFPLPSQGGASASLGRPARPARADRGRRNTRGMVPRIRRRKRKNKKKKTHRRRNNSSSHMITISRTSLVQPIARREMPGLPCKITNQACRVDKKRNRDRKAQEESWVNFHESRARLVWRPETETEHY